MVKSQFLSPLPFLERKEIKYGIFGSVKEVRALLPPGSNFFIRSFLLRLLGANATVRLG